MTMTLSPQSTWGVNVGLCLPRSRMATSEASRPTTRPSASIITHFFSTSAGFAEKVFMCVSIEKERQMTGAVARLLPGTAYGVNGSGWYFEHFQSVGMEVFSYLMEP